MSKIGGIPHLLILLASILATTISGCQTRTVPQTTTAPPTQAITRVNGIGFEGVGASAGLKYRYPKQKRPMRNLEAFGSGCAFFDYDDDGWQDILLVTPPHPHLYRNLHNGKFADVTDQVRLSTISGDWKGCAIGDYNDDGTLDIVLTGYHCLALLKNVGGKRFVDVTAEAGLSPTNGGKWGASAGFMELAGHGHLDLILLNYVVFGAKEQQYCEIRTGVKSGCPPSVYHPEFPELWENLGNGKLRDVTAASGLAKTSGKSLVVAFADADHDGRPDFYIGNDGTPAELMHNDGNLHFTNRGLASGVAYGAQEHTMAAMGADWADYDRDGQMDLAVPGFSDESYMVYHAVGHDLFEQTGDLLGIAGATFKPLGFGTKWMDFDNDGYPDLIFANGHVYDNVSEIDPLLTFLQPLMLFHNKQGKSFEDMVPALGGSVAQPILGRGLATGDFDNDGKMDFLVVDYEGAPMLFHNVSQTPNHFLMLDLRRSGSNRFAYGTQVLAKSGKEQWVGMVSPASSYLSSSDPRIHLGLGKVVMLDSLTIRWTDGQKQTLKNVRADRILRIVEP